MRPRTQKQPQVKKELCLVLDYVNVKKKKMNFDSTYLVNSDVSAV